ncbi:G-protein-signaling modulator 3 isoform X2 [Protopterus annectens]|uniref:G-protein-signaling modulator 3 isoform X2 n=1 Tax=Protopterus annectens TaxID=7888 RepID=UPI001CFB54AF|nr:G-protein-signaling modulator 3 isoform X2 [Protopterus annectens]
MKEPKDEMELEMKGNEVEKHNWNTTESAINDEDMMSANRNDEVANTALPISSAMGCELLEQRENEAVKDNEKGEEKEEKAVENIEKEDEEKEEEEDRQQFSQRCGNRGTQITSFDNEELLPKLDECTDVTMPPEENLADENIIIVESRPADSLSTPLEIILDSHNKPEGDVLYTKSMETSEELNSNEIMECKENDTTQNEGDCDKHGSCAIMGAKDPSVDRREVNTKEEEGEENKEPKMKQKHTSVSFFEEGDEVFDRVCDDHPSLLRSSSGTDLEAMYQNADAIDSEHLFEMLCRCQSRRLNDQRCSFRRKKLAEGTRPWKSAPASPATERKVFFASVTSLQAERFFDMLACSQSRRLNDQRADFQEVSVNQCQEELQSKPEPEPEPQVKATAAGAAAAAMIKEPNQVPDDDLYNTIITYQAGRIDDQRSDPPLPAAAEDFFDLILRVQGGRMEEQRVALPPSLKNTAQRVNAI